MARVYQKDKSATGGLSSLNILEHIEKLVEIDRSKSQFNQDELLFFLKRWWCQHYKRPYKDPLLDTYTLEELYYEFCDINFKEDSDTNHDSDKPEIPQEEWDWAAEEEAKELEERMRIEAENDTIDIGSSDDEWANRYTEGVKVNPDISASDEGGDIIANFES